jgi:hypothetical protein
MEELRRELAAQRWHPCTPFDKRLVTLRRVLQAALDQLPVRHSYEPRIAVTVRLELEELALLLPPTEQRLLAHLRARKPLRSLIGTRGFRTAARLNERLQRLLSRIQAYCGSPVRHRLMQPYDRPGHAHRRRPGPPRRMIPDERLPELRLWVPGWFATVNRHCLIITEGTRTTEEMRRIKKRRAVREPAPERDAPAACREDRS